jgi:hypothetical protein
MTKSFRLFALMLGAFAALPAYAGDSMTVKCGPNQERVWVYDSLTSFDISVKLKCGESVEMIGRVKGYVKVRTQSGTEGFIPDAAFSNLPPFVDEKEQQTSMPQYAARRAQAAPSASQRVAAVTPVRPAPVATQPAPAAIVLSTASAPSTPAVAAPPAASAPAAPVRVASNPPAAIAAPVNSVAANPPASSTTAVAVKPAASPAPAEPSAAAAPAAPVASNTLTSKPATPAPTSPAPHAVTVSSSSPASPAKAASATNSSTKAASSKSSSSVSSPAAHPAAPAPAPAPPKPAPATTSAAAPAETTAVMVSPHETPALHPVKATAPPESEDYPDFEPISESADPACQLFFSAYGLSPAQFKWFSQSRKKKYPAICPAPDVSRVDFVLIFTHDVDIYSTTLPTPVHTDHNGFSDFSPMSTVDTAVISGSAADKAHHEYVWVFTMKRGAFDPSHFSPRRRPQFNKAESNSLTGHGGSLKTVDDAFHYMEEQGPGR